MVIPSGPLEALACVKGEKGIQGTVKFYPVACGTLVVVELAGLPDTETGFFSLHIHEGDSCGGAEFEKSKGHFDPGGEKHPRHAGDLPPLLSRDGRAFLAAETGRFAAWEVAGRTVVVHSGPDDFRSQPAGAPGRKLACGVIRSC